MTTHFQWTTEQRKSVTIGATVCISGSPNHDAGRFEITSTSERFVFLRPIGGGPVFSCPWHRVDATTLSTTADDRQLGLFGGGK